MITDSVAISKIRELRAQVWEASEHNNTRVNKAIAACGPRESTIAYWERVLLILMATPEKTARKSKYRIPEELRKRYTEAYHQYQTKFPNWVKDGHTLDPQFPDVSKANGLTTFIINYINWTGGNATRINVAGRLVDTERGSKYIKSSTRKGQADATSTIRGKSVKWEVKVGRDKPSADQLKEQLRERAAGGEYFFTHTVEEFFERYDSLT